MMTFFTILQSSIFILLSVLHLHWAMGGRFGFGAAIPTKENGENLMNPGKIDSAIVGLALMAFGLFYLVKIGWIALGLPFWLMNYTGWVIAGIFILRTVGDFRYLGFFKKHKDSAFGKMDTLFYSPLCLGLGIVGLMLA